LFIFITLTCKGWKPVMALAMTALWATDHVKA
jgi:hypothetical protein